MYNKATLDNGLKIITHSMEGMQSVSLGIWIKVGGRYEQGDKKGISHLMEHLLFKGSRDYSCSRIKESIEGVGGSLNGFTSEEFTCYLVKLPAEYLDTGLGVLSDMVLRPSLPEEELVKEKQVIIEEIKMYKDLPQAYVHELLDSLLWPKQPLGMAIAGSVESVTATGRDDLLYFHKNYYIPKNIVISAAGKLVNEKFIAGVKKIFSGSNAQDPREFAQAEVIQDKPQLNLFFKETEQTHLSLGFHSFKRDHQLKHALSLLNIILGANMSSRLFNEIREKRGLAYEIGSGIRVFYDTGAFIIKAGIDNFKVLETIKLILSQLQLIINQPVSDDEFQRAKKFSIGQISLAMEDTLNNMLWIGESTSALDRVDSLEKIKQEINAVSIAEINQAARDVFLENRLNLAIIGPLKDSDNRIFNQLKI